MDEITAPRAESPQGHQEPLLAEIRRDDVCMAVMILSDVYGIFGSAAYQLLVRGAEHAQLSVRETARLVVMSPSLTGRLEDAS